MKFRNTKPQIVLTFKRLNISNKPFFWFLIAALPVLLFFGCGKDSFTKRKGVRKVVEGYVIEDCNGSVAKGKRVILKYQYSGCFSHETISEETTLTDNKGYFRFEYVSAVDDGSTTYHYHTLSIPNSTIMIANPSGRMNLYPNDTLMNAIVNLKFKNRYSAQDTFFYQFVPSPKGFIEHGEQISFLVGPFPDTSIVLKNMRVGNTNNLTELRGQCGSFKWGIGKGKLNRYFTGKDGSFDFTHKPCTEFDRFEYNVRPK